MLGSATPAHAHGGTDGRTLMGTCPMCVVVTFSDIGLYNLVVKLDERPGYQSGSDICTAPPKVRLLAEQARGAFDLSYSLCSQSSYKKQNKTNKQADICV